MRRWKMMFDRRGDVLRCEFLDGPPLSNGEELIVVEERPVSGSREGGSATGPSDPPGAPDPDAVPEPDEVELDPLSPLDPAAERPLVSA